MSVYVAFLQNYLSHELYVIKVSHPSSRKLLGPSRRNYDGNFKGCNEILEWSFAF